MEPTSETLGVIAGTVGVVATAFFTAIKDKRAHVLQSSVEAAKERKAWLDSMQEEIKVLRREMHEQDRKHEASVNALRDELFLEKQKLAELALWTQRIIALLPSGIEVPAPPDSVASMFIIGD